MVNICTLKVKELVIICSLVILDIPVPPGVNVQIGHNDSVQGVILGWPPQKWGVPSGFSRYMHARIGANSSVSQLQEVTWGHIQDIWDNLH